MFKKQHVSSVNVISFICLFVLFTIGVYSQFGGQTAPKSVAEENYGSTGITWVPIVNYSKLILTVSKPDGSIFSKTFESGVSPYVNISDLNENGILDGIYTYELRVVSRLYEKVRDDYSTSEIHSQSDLNREEFLSQTGYFTITGGMMVTPTAVEPGLSDRSVEANEDGLSRTADQVINDDLIVMMSLCVGNDCINAENFGYDTVRLKENNLRIRFYDTSNSGSFPTNDWEITANDSLNGGASYLAFKDIDSGRTPFTVMAGTRNNALFVSENGRIGFGTSTPSEDLQIWYGDTPTIRLDQSGSGWAPQAWDISGNETNFFIRDVTNGGNLPFRIRAGAPHNSLYINTDGKIGINTQTPTAPVHVYTDTTGAGNAGVYVYNANTGTAEIQTEKSGGAKTYMSGATNYGFFGTWTSHPLRLSVNGSYVVEVNSTGHYINVKDGGYYDGNWVGTSSRSLKENIKELNSDDALNALEGLTPVRYNYKTNKAEEHVGFIAEDVPELVAQNDRKSLSPLDIVAVLTKVLKEQQKTIKELKEEVVQLKKKIEQK